MNIDIVNNWMLEKNIGHWFKYDHLSSHEGIALLAGLHPTEEIIHELNTFDPRRANRGLLFSGVERLDGDFIMPVPPDNAKKDANDCEVEEWDIQSQWDFCTPEEIDKAVLKAHHELSQYAYLYQTRLSIWNSGKHPEMTPLSYFVEWARLKGESPRWLPVAEKLGLVHASSPCQSNESPAVANNQTISDSTIDRTHVSNSLAILNQAARQWWANANRDDPQTHPKNAHVVSWLMDHGYQSKTLAEKAATIIRPEWATTGRPQEK